MSWLTNFVLPKSGPSARSAPKFVAQVPGCEQLAVHRELRPILKGAAIAATISGIAPAERFRILSTAARSILAPTPRVAVDPLRFRDASATPTAQRRAHAVGGAGSDAIAVAHRPHRRHPGGHRGVRFRVHGGSMGVASARRLSRRRGSPSTARPALILVPVVGRRAHAGGHPVADAEPRTSSRRHGKKPVCLHRPADDPTTGGRVGLAGDGGDNTLAEPGRGDRFAVPA